MSLLWTANLARHPNSHHKPDSYWLWCCGRAVWNITPSEALVFHHTLNTTKASFTGRIPSSIPQGRTRIIHIFSLDLIMRTSLQYLIHYIQLEFLENILLQYQVQSAEFKQWNYNKPLTIEYKDPSVPTRRILHTTATLQAAPTTGVNKPWVHNVLARLTWLVGIISRLHWVW